MDRLAGLEEEYAEATRKMGDPAVLSDQRALRTAGRRVKELEPIVDASRRLRAAIDDRDAANELLTDAEGEDRTGLKEELAKAEADIAAIEAELQVLLLPKDPNADKNVIVEIRGAEGGAEANLWAGSLFDMYQRFAERNGWKQEVLSVSPSDLGGIDEATFRLVGDDAWTRMKHEAGPHRVQRVPVTESQGRIHTSSATVTVLP